MRESKIRDYQRGFALPTVLIASVVMFIVLLTALGATSSISEGLRNQHLDRISREAAQSGVAMAQACIDGGSSAGTWTSAKPLKPNTDCVGDETTSCPTTSTDGACYVLQNGNFRTLYRVTVITDSGGNPTGISSEGVVRQVRTSNGVVSKESTVTLKATLKGEPLTWKQISAGGYHACGIASDNKAYCWGRNTYGQLGDSTTTNSSTPVAVSQGAMPAGATVLQIYAGNYHTCAIASDNKMYCWGYNFSGQLGDGTTTNRTSPVAVSQGAMPSGATIQQVSPGGSHTCAIASDNQAYCWGLNSSGQLGSNSTTNSNTPVKVVTSFFGGLSFRQISTGVSNTCIIASDNQAYCWGSNAYGQLGIGSTTQYYGPVTAAGGALAGQTVREITVGATYACAVASDNKAYCWGAGSSGQLGNNSTATSLSPVAVSQGLMPAGATVQQISASISSSSHTCAIASDNKAYCWGYAATYGLGNGSSFQRNTPGSVSQGAMPAAVTVKQISATSYGYGCAIASDNKAYCWGYNSYGQLGDGTTTQQTTPVAVTGVSSAGVGSATANSVAVGSSHACAIASDNKAYCWGSNSYGQLGDSTNTTRNSPVSIVQGAMPTGAIVRQVSTNAAHTCAIASDNQAYCQGYNGYGQLGDGTTTQRNTPVAVAQGAIPAGATFRQISVGLGNTATQTHTCAIASDNKAYCWGYNGYSQLGDGVTTTRTSPVAVLQGAMPASATFRQISAGGIHSCGIASDNKAYCWGYNFNGQVGDGTSTTRTTPVAVAQGAMPAGATFRQISTGGSYSCGIASDNKAYCWGFNSSGQLGDGTTTTRTTPVAVAQGAMPAGATFRQISTGSTYACAIASDNKVYCWGSGASGKLGDGAALNRTSPVAVTQGGMPSGVIIRDVSAGNSSATCAIASDNKVYCWGLNSSGQLGDGTTTSTTAPSETKPFPGASASAGVIY
ncbi:MAG TPA: hypothetical protein VGE34_01010 [Candidatus Saccharimonadales bacterium]